MGEYLGCRSADRSSGVGGLLAAHRSKGVFSGNTPFIYNDDFRTILSHDQVAFGFPASAGDLRNLITRVRATGITTYVIDSIEYDNKVYFETKRGIDWAEIDFAQYEGDEGIGRRTPVR